VPTWIAQRFFQPAPDSAQAKPLGVLERTPRGTRFAVAEED